MKRTIASTMVFLALTGCATIFNGTTQTVTIRTSPEAAAVMISNRAGESVHSGNSPVTVTLKRGAGYFKPEVYTVRVQKDGYEPKEVLISNQVSGWYFGNILFGGLITGMLIVDPLTGAMYTLAPDVLETTLEAVGAKTSKADDSLTVVLVDDVPVDTMRSARRLN
ncbi:MAG: hypothetical protein Q8R95_04560 [Azonexus sp.]|nr:hypothetical protein [Azonexus sp.]